MSPETLGRVRAIIAANVEIPIDKVAPEAALQDLGLDSLGVLELIFQLEEEFKILVPNDRASEFTTVQAICDGIETLLATPAHAK